MPNRSWGAVTALSLGAMIALSLGGGAAGAATKKMTKKNGKTSAAALIAQGKKFVTADGCAGCHKIAGKGGTTGPDLSHLGTDTDMTAAKVAAKIKDPKASKPNSIMPASHRPDKEIAAMAAYLKSLK
jgi:cytochrome c oxidase subunit 2